MKEYSPKVTPHIIVALAPIDAPFLTSVFLYSFFLSTEDRGLITLVKTNKFQQLLLELNAQWNDFHARLNIVIEENIKLRNIIESELKDY